MTVAEFGQLFFGCFGFLHVLTNSKQNSLALTILAALCLKAVHQDANASGREKEAQKTSYSEVRWIKHEAGCNEANGQQGASNDFGASVW